MSKTPSFWKPDKIGEQRRADLLKASEEGSKAGLKSFIDDKIKRIVVGIDYQVDFVRDDGTLKVEGALGDLQRFIDFIYRKAETITGFLFTMDKHLPFQIFYPPWWRDKNGNQPAPFTPIKREDVENGNWIPQMEKTWSLHQYTQELEKTGQSPLLIWPYHCMAGDSGSTLIPELSEAVQWLSTARRIQPIFMFKGTVAKSEHYGPFCCCVPVPDDVQGGLQTQYLDLIAKYDEIIFAGEAEDFCVREAMKQVLEYFKDRPDVLKKILFLKDCTSLVFPDKRDEADKILEDFASKGVQIVNSTDL